MMSANYISTLMLSSSLRSSITNNQAALSRASTQATTGRFADVGLELGATTGGDVTLRADWSFADQLIDTNELVSGRLDVTQNRITQLGTTATDFLKDLIAVVPYTIHTVLTDNGIQFCELPRNRTGATAGWRTQMFDLLCRANRIEHRLTKPRHPWTNGQVERMNRTIKDATVKRFYYETHDELRKHLADFVAAYNYARRLKTLRGLTPYEAICKA